MGAIIRESYAIRHQKIIRVSIGLPLSRVTFVSVLYEAVVVSREGLLIHIRRNYSVVKV